MELTEIKQVPLNQITQGENSRILEEKNLYELMGSMNENGLLQVIGLKEIAKDKFEVIYGNRRFLSAKKLGWYSIEAKIFKNLDAENTQILNLVENVSRKNLTLLEYGNSLQELKKKYDLSDKELSIRLGVTEHTVKKYIKDSKRIPTKYIEDVKIIRNGSTPGKGIIPATVASRIIQTSKRMNLTKDKIETLFKIAKESKTPLDSLKIKALALSLRESSNEKKAKDSLQDIAQLKIIFNLSKSDIDKFSSRLDTAKYIRESVYKMPIFEDSLNLNNLLKENH